MLCSLCNKPVSPSGRLVWQRTIGWARPGKAGGSDIVMRKGLDEWAHDECIQLERRGLLNQESLI
jgi:hypothetical protein